MGRQATGVVVQTTVKGKDGRGDISFAMRVPYNGRRPQITLGRASEGWTRQRAEKHMADTMAAIRLGHWRPDPGPAPVIVDHDPTFHVFTSEWWAEKKLELSPGTVAKYELEITCYLLPFFRKHRLSEIRVRDVDAFKGWMLARNKARHPNSKKAPQKLGTSTVNAAITRLGQILEAALEQELIDRNPVKVGARKVRATKSRPVYLDSALHIATLIEACGLCDAPGQGGRVTIGRRPLVATLVLAGLRSTEACELTWRDVDLAGGRIKIGNPGATVKTQAAYREVDIHALLRDELLEWKSNTPLSATDDLVFPTREGRRRDKDNVGARVVRPAVLSADALLTKRKEQPLPHGVTPHKLRHTYASWMCQVFKDPYYVMGQLGHTDARFTMRVYTHAMARTEPEREALRALIGLPQSSQIVSNGPASAPTAPQPIPSTTAP